GDEHGLAALHGALQLRIPLQVHHVVADRRILVGRHEPHGLAAPLREEDGAAVEAERLAQLARDRLQDVDEVERGGHFLEDLDHREEMRALALERSEERRVGKECRSRWWPYQ